MAVELAAARDLHLQKLRQGIDHRHAHAVQTARGLIDLGVELAARMQRGHDDLERGLVLELRMRIDRNAAAVVGHGQKSVGIELHLDERGVARHGLIHRVVDDFREEVVQRLFVSTADIHARPAPDRLQALENLDVCRTVAVGCVARAIGASRRLALGSLENRLSGPSRQR